MKNIGGRHNLYHCPCSHPLAPSVDVTPQRVVSMISSEQEKEVVGSCKKKRSSPRRSFTRLVRAVISETVMRRKSKKIQQDPYQALRNLSCVRKSKSMREEEESNSRKSSSLTSSITSTSSCSSASSSSLSNSSLVSFGSKSFGSNSSDSSSRFLGLDDPKQSNSEEIAPKQGHSTNELWWVVLSLVVLIFFGRICAIICTLTWIYYGPFRRGRRNEEDTKREQMQQQVQVQVQVQEENLDSREYKKRVVMGGFLERRHSRF